MCINGRQGIEGSRHRWRVCVFAEGMARGPGVWVTGACIYGRHGVGTASTCGRCVYKQTEVVDVCINERHEGEGRSARAVASMRWTAAVLVGSRYVNSQCDMPHQCPSPPHLRHTCSPAHTHGPLGDSNPHHKGWPYHRGHRPARSARLNTPARKDNARPQRAPHMPTPGESHAPRPSRLACAGGGWRACVPSGAQHSCPRDGL